VRRALTPIIIDLSLIAIVLFCAWRGYKGGLIRGVFGVVALVASLLFANVAASAYSDEFTGVLTPFVGGVVESALSEMVEDHPEFDPQLFNPREFDPDDFDPDDLDLSDFDLDDLVFEDYDFERAFTALREIGLPEAAAISIAGAAMEVEHDRFIADVIADKLSSTLSYIAIFAISFILLAIIFAVIGNLVGVAFSLPGLKLLDVIAGGVLGFVKGMLIILTLGVVVRYFGLLALPTVEETRVLYYLVNNNMIATMLGV